MLLKEKEIRQSFNVLGIAYCDLQYLLRFYYRTGYTAGTYGWKADYYQVDNSNFMISTGYSPLQTVKIDDKTKREIIYDFNEAAKKINTKEEADILLDQFMRNIKLYIKY